MPIYKGTTELTKIADFLAATDHDITEVYFGDKQVFTVWGEYDGTLPATYSANGDYLADYRVYGAAGGVGDRTPNIFDESGVGLIDVTGGGAMRYGKNFGTVLAGTYSITYTRVGSAPYFYVGKKSGSNHTNTYVNPRGSGTTTAVEISEGDELYVWALHTEINKSFAQMGITEIVLVSDSTVPAEYVPYGYEVDMSIENWSPYNTHTGKIIDMTTGDENSAAQYTTAYFNNFFSSTAVISVKTDTAGGGRSLRYVPYDANQVPMLEYKEETNFVRDGRVAQLMVTIPSGAAYYGVSYHNGDTRKKISTTTPIYIGSDPLGEDEYVSFKEQKVYRMSGGVLTPTDPPVPLPALPTVDGTNIVDYAGQSAAVPSRFVAKYRKEGY